MTFTIFSFVCQILLTTRMTFVWSGIKNYFPTYFVRAAGNHGHHQVTPTDKFVGFSAGLTKMLKTNDTELIVYDRVFLNMGNGYDSSTGVFTCPNAGTYAFLVHGVSTATSQLNLDIYRNNNYTVSVFAHVNNGYASGHQSIILQLDQRESRHQNNNLNLYFENNS